MPWPRWFRDPLGRAVVLHGLFAVWKGTPFYPPDDAVLPNGFTDADADRFAELGFDAVRLAYTYRLSWRSGELRTLAHAKAQVISRVYPRAVAGTPRAYGFDPRTGRFHLTYATRRGVRGPTVITVPSAVHYPNGYRVRASGAWVVSKGGDRVVLVKRPRARVVSVTVEPPRGDTTARPSLIACAG